MASNPPPFAVLLRDFRVRAELTQEELAERARLSARVVSDLERGVSRAPRAHTVRQLADALELSPPERARFTEAGRPRQPPAETDGLREPVTRDAAAKTGTADVRTFLIADVRGYTAFTLEHGDEAAAALAAKFAEVTQRVVVQHGGRAVELRGDEALVVFSSSRQSLRAAVDLQSSYASESSDELPLRVGIGLDASEAVPIDGGYRGAALNLATRLCSLAGGAEVLASEAIVHLARKLDGLAYVERGFIELEGFAEPIRVVEVVVDLEAEQPLGEQQGLLTARMSAREPTMPIGGFLGALPAGSVVGRSDELDHIMAVTDLVASGSGQFVLLAGERGSGKT